MALHAYSGKTGEDLAADWLIAKGFSILCRNWRHGRYEVDLIAGRKGILHFIEVKSRRSTAYGHPEESVDRKKLEHVLQAASGWLHRWPAYSLVQFDVLSVTLKKKEAPEFTLFEDVYL